MINTDTKGLTIENLAELEKEIEPTLPENFPTNRLPTGDLCAHVLSRMLVCTMKSQQNLCGSEIKDFYICRRERDAQIFSAIKSWEEDQVANIADREGYV